MNFKQDEEHRDILEMVHDFAVNEVKPLAAEIDRTEEFPMKNVKMMAEMGLMGIPFPEEYGGSGMDTLAYIQTVEELSKYCASTGVILSAHTSLCATPIYQFGTEEQKQKYLPKLCSGEWIGAFALTEPNAGTDASGQKTVAVDAGDHWVLNGSKIFITNAGAADVFFVLAMTDKSLGTKGISAFIVEKGYPGFSIGKQEDKLGIRASSTCELIFEDCIVPKENYESAIDGLKHKMYNMLTINQLLELGHANVVSDEEYNDGFNNQSSLNYTVFLKNLFREYASNTATYEVTFKEYDDSYYWYSTKLVD